NYWPRLRYISRPLRAIYRERDRPPLFDLSPHSEQRPHRSLRTRSPHLHESELLHDAPGVLAIEAVAAHHPHLQIAAPIHGGDHAVVPEGIDARPFCQAFRRAFFP